MRQPPGTVARYTAGARINHWITAGCLILLALSGMALFHPSLFFLTNLFGGGSYTRSIHPWFGRCWMMSIRKASGAGFQAPGERWGPAAGG